MYMSSYAVQINPPGVLPILTADQVWKGLEMKAAYAVPFVPGMTRCVVLEREGNTLLREISVSSGDFRERITFYAPVQVQFERIGSEGFIQNTISESEAGLLLTFTFGIPFLGTSAGSEEERAKGGGMRTSYVEAVNATLRKVRQMVENKEL
jgi:hypothetical protein